MGLTKKSFKQVPRLNLRIESSWDDGHKLDMKTAELLKKYGIRGTFYIIVNNADREDHLSWKEIKCLRREFGFDIGSHTMSHPQDLKKLYEEDLWYEIQNSKDLLETVLGENISKFCYPRGRYNEVVKSMVNKAGYVEARTTIVGHLEKPKNTLEKHTTVHVYDGRPEYAQKNWLVYAREKLAEAMKDPKDKVFHIWGHSEEVDRGNQWDNLETFFKELTEKVIII